MKRYAKTLRRVGLVANPEKTACRQIVRRAIDLVRQSRRSVVLDAATAHLANMSLPGLPSVAAVARSADVLLVFGGDGTMLRVAREVAGQQTPILGVNLGRLGFLTAVPSNRLRQALACLWGGDFILETRDLIVADYLAAGHASRQYALNEFVISRGTLSRLIELEVAVNGELLTRYLCDGLIVCSPTGSTAYSLSAGGAIVSPQAEVFTLTPICPHTLSNRSVIVDLHSTVQVTARSSKPETTLTADGQVQATLASLDTVTIRRSQRRLRLVRLAGSSFFETLRQKLNWSGSHI